MQKNMREVDLAPIAAQQLLHLPTALRWRLVESVFNLASDPYLRNLKEENDETFIITEGYAIHVLASDREIHVLYLKKHMAN